MVNWLTKLFNKEKPPLAISQGNTSFHAIPKKTEEASWEEAHVVEPSSPNIPIEADVEPSSPDIPIEAHIEPSSPGIPEAETPPADNKDKETQILFEAFKKLTPEYFFVIAEMRNLLCTEIKKIVFHALSTGLSVEDVALHLGISHTKVNTIYREAIRDIRMQTGFVKRYLDNAGRKKMPSEQEVNEQETDLPPQPEKTTRKCLLSDSLRECLHLETRVINIFRYLELNTVEDLLRFTSAKGLAYLTKQRNFGKVSLSRLTDELIRKGIFKPDGSCDLYNELPTISRKKH